MALSLGLSIYSGVKEAKKLGLRGTQFVKNAIVFACAAPGTDAAVPRRRAGTADVGLGVAAIAIGILMAIGILHLPLPAGIGTGLMIGGGISTVLALRSLVVNEAKNDLDSP